MGRSEEKIVKVLGAASSEEALKSMFQVLCMVEYLWKKMIDLETVLLIKVDGIQNEALEKHYKNFKKTRITPYLMVLKKAIGEATWKDLEKYYKD